MLRSVQTWRGCHLSAEFVNNITEVCVIKLKSSATVTLVALFSPPQSDFEMSIENLSALLVMIQSEGKFIVIGSDVNINFERTKK